MIDVHIWDGNTVETTFMDIADPVEWSMLVVGDKTQMRSVDRLLRPDFKPTRIVMARHGTSFIPFVVSDISRQMLGEMRSSDYRAEGFDSPSAFKTFWLAKQQQAFFSEHERVWAYTLERLDMSKLDDPAMFEAVHRLVESLYPLDFQ